MNRRFGFGLLGVIVLLLVALGVGAVAFNMGLAQGVAQSVQLGDGAPLRAAPYLFYPHAWGFGFGIGGIFIFLLLLFLIFALVRRLFWGGPWGGWGMRGRYGRWNDDPAHETHAPPFFEEWHRQAHAQQPPEQQNKQ